MHLLEINADTKALRTPVVKTTNQFNNQLHPQISVYLQLNHQFSNLLDYGIFFLKGHLFTCGLNSLLSSVYLRSLESVRNWIMEWLHCILSILSNDMFIQQLLMQRSASSLALQLKKAIYSTSMSIFFLLQL